MDNGYSLQDNLSYWNHKDMMLYEATRRMKLLNISEDVISDFVDGGNIPVFYSENTKLGNCTFFSNFGRKIRNLERKTSVIVYAVIRSTKDGVNYVSCLYVSPIKEEWVQERRYVKEVGKYPTDELVLKVYSESLDRPYTHEFGEIWVENINWSGDPGTKINTI